MEVYALQVLEYDESWYVVGVYTSEELAREAARDAGISGNECVTRTFTLNAPLE